MKNILKSIALTVILGLSAGTLINCYGSFSLIRKVYNWNGTVGDKFVNTAVMWVLMIIPVYEFTGLIDFLVLNTIQFWTGRNPMAMAPGEKDIRIVKVQDKQYEVTATQNRLDIVPLNQAARKEKITMIYQPDKGQWIYKIGNRTGIAGSMDQNNQNTVKLYHPDGQVVRVAL